MQRLVRQVRHEDGTQEGTYGWVDPNGVLRYFWGDGVMVMVIKCWLRKCFSRAASECLHSQQEPILLDLTLIPSTSDKNKLLNRLNFNKNHL